MEQGLSGCPEACASEESEAGDSESIVERDGADDTVDAVDRLGRDLERWIDRVDAPRLDERIVGAGEDDLHQHAVLGVDHHRVAPGDERLLVDTLDEDHRAVVEAGLHAVAADADGEICVGDRGHHFLAVGRTDTVAPHLEISGIGRDGEHRNLILLHVDRGLFGLGDEHLSRAVHQPLAVKIGEMFGKFLELVEGEALSHRSDIGGGDAHALREESLGNAFVLEIGQESALDGRLIVFFFFTLSHRMSEC